MLNHDNSAVRRQDRLLESEKTLELLRDGEYGVLSICGEGGQAYGIPLNYVLVGDVIYVHCAPEGRKFDLIHRNPGVSFCVVGPTDLRPGKFTTGYSSVVASGTASTVSTENEKIRALRALVGKYSRGFETAAEKYIAGSLHRTAVIKIDIDSVSGKRKD